MTPDRQPQHCDHECVCMGYCNRNEMYDDLPCKKTACEYDTRPHTPAAPATEPDIIIPPKCSCSSYTSCDECMEGARERVMHIKQEAAKAERERVVNREITALSNQIGALQSLEPEFGSENEVEIRVLSRWRMRLQESLRGGEQR